MIRKTVEGDSLYKVKPIWNWFLANSVLYDKPILNVKGKLLFGYQKEYLCRKSLF